MSTNLTKPVTTPSASVGRRIAVIIAYAAGVFLVVWSAFRVLLSKQCLDGPVCSPVETILQTVIGLAMLISWGGIVALGWTGRLPGAKGRVGARGSETNSA